MAFAIAAWRCVLRAWNVAAPCGAVWALVITAGAARAGETPTPGSVPAAVGVAPDFAYRIGALDKLSVTVFQVKDLSLEHLQVDPDGRVLLPLIGPMLARGKTAAELSSDIAGKLGERYLQSPRVLVSVEDAVGQKISVEGAVNEAGVFELKGRTSLLEAVARAKGAGKDANLHRVTIVRNVDGAPHAATFDLAAIGAGRARNPEVIGNDVVIVGGSGVKDVWHGMVQLLPAIYVFSYL